MAEIIQIKFKVDGKEITATEKDLKELQRATRQAEKAGGKASKSIDGMGVALKGLGALAAAAAMVKFAADTAAAVREIDNLAMRAGIGTTEFQKHAVAARSVGVEADKLADIYKDVNDKVGDFVTTGAGPLADFFDGIGKQMGVTIDDFKELSGPDALGKYVKTLEEAGASQQEMTFFMEAIASDAVLLAPLYRDGAAALNEMGAAATGVLSEETIGKAKVLDDKFNELADTIKGQVTLAVVDASTAMGIFLGVLQKPVKTDAQRSLENLTRAGETLNKELQLYAEAQREGDAEDLRRATNRLQYAKNDFAYFTQRKADAEQEEKDIARIAAAEKAATDAKNKALADARAGGLKEAARLEALADKQKAADAAALKTQEAQIEGFKLLANPMKEYTDKLALIDTLMEAAKDDDETLLALGEAYRLITLDAEAFGEAAGKAFDEKETAEANRLEDLAVKYGHVTDKAGVYRDEIAEIKEVADEYNLSQEWMLAQQAKLGEESPWAGLQEELNGFDAKIKEMTVDGVIGLAEGFAQMAVSGEKNMEEMATAMLKQIAAVIIQALIMKAILSFTGGGADAGPAVASTSGAGVSFPMDSGGQGAAGDAFLIGTGAQPELFVPQTSGQFIPKQQILAGMSGGGVTIGSVNVVVKENKGESSAEQANKISKAITREMKSLINSEITNQSRSGNMLNPVPQATFR